VNLKRKVMQMHVEIEFMTRGKDVVAQAHRQALQEVWKALPQELFDLLIESMED
jgi:hypothetical protein